ncbi:Crp/Fnr family transcriptional regulator [Fulvivirga lutimaris]|uniref:Crp/Fnr family transcriptional regulator n=1 Tax=Fulvivirga lutimaris TaxID=1819566 RepID=UPI0012BC900A|nr:cyclic nucleotide-binding domain-containing protein [Fulvivirga lutimaris]MTI40627.1 cyclic nucleotide-binding domain-containing protein [Fulvivirga lutimaris]
MPSVIPGYEYDIFISYRHKDNKYDGWVTTFVNNLKKELEATFKEAISVYFDENTTDGLLDTHNVDSSLSSKIKSLIFIPVLSQTYCDVNSFAWKNEFIAFNTLSLNDNFGREIKLRSGNVANRILPVKIHELEVGDEQLIFDIMNSHLRSVDFIYQLPGVNRPLLPEDDGRGNNPYFYRDQVNKVANACKEIIAGMKSIHSPESHQSVSNIGKTVSGASNANSEQSSKPNDRQLLFRMKIIQQVEIFSLLSDKHLEEVASEIKTLSLKEDEVIFNKGELGDSMFIIVDGRVKVHDEDHVFSFLSGGECFGEYTLIDEDYRSASVTALESTTLYRVDQQVFQNLINTHPAFANSVLRVLIKRLRRLDIVQQELASSYKKMSNSRKEFVDSKAKEDALHEKYEKHADYGLKLIQDFDQLLSNTQEQHNLEKLKEVLEDMKKLGNSPSEA